MMIPAARITHCDYQQLLMKLKEYIPFEDIDWGWPKKAKKAIEAVAFRSGVGDVTVILLDHNHKVLHTALYSGGWTELARYAVVRTAWLYPISEALELANHEAEDREFAEDCEMVLGGIELILKEA